jgi:alanine dehydrogenase
MPLLITEEDVRALMARPNSTAEAIEIMKRSLLEQARGDVAHRTRVTVDHPPGSSAWALLGAPGRSIGMLPGIVPGLGAACARIYTTCGRGQSPCELLVLFDVERMQLRAIIEDYSLHGLRTAAPSALAAKLLSRPDAERVGVVGSGRQARAQLAAVATVRRVSEVRAFSPNAERLRAFCDEMQAALECPVLACERAEDAVRDADIVVTATTTTDPVLSGEWLAPGVHVNSTAPAELDEQAILSGRVFPCFSAQVIGGVPPWAPIPALLEQGRISEQDLSTELCRVVAGDDPGRRSPEEITIFLSTGMATWDAAIAVWADAQSRAMGLGRELWGDRGRTVEGYMSPLPST